MKFPWDTAAENMKKATELQPKYYNERHRMIKFQIEDLVFIKYSEFGIKGIQWTT